MIEKYGLVKENEPIKKHTTYKLKGKIAKIVYPKDKQNLIKLIKYLKKNNIKHKIIGNGSNLIFTKDYNGVIIKLNNLNSLKIKNNIIKVEAGYSLTKLSLQTAKLSLSGLEFASGIPATIGGAIYMNAGAYNKDMASIIKEVLVLDENLNLKTLTKKDLNFNYRSSILKEKNYICLEATLELTPKPKEEILKLIKDRKERRIKTQPLNYPSAGSVFRNPKNDFAARLIEEAGLKGKNINDAKVSEKHANFIINSGNASGEDIKKLINYIQNKIKEKYDIELILEQEIIE